jgi:O-antigen ligase
MAIQSHPFSPRDIKIILDTLIWCASITGAYVFFQCIAMDQFFVCGFGDNARMAGFIGNPTQCAPLIAMVAPIAIFRKKYIHLAVIVISVILIRSAFGYLGLALSVLSYFSIINRKFLVRVLIILSTWVLLVLVVNTNHIQIKNQIVKEALEFNQNSRFEHWAQISKDIVSDIDTKVGQKYPLTGRGLGSFKVVYHAQHKNNYIQAHNEYLELAYTSGIIGLILFLFAIWSMFKRALSKEKLFLSGTPRYRASLMAGIVCTLVVSCGTFILQVGTTAFVSVVLCGLLENQSDLIL